MHSHYFFSGGLSEIQSNRCFYCGKALGKKQKTKPEVDHFVPWARYPNDGLANLVVAHSACNLAKSDHVAAFEHYQHWQERNADQAALSTIDVMAVESQWEVRLVESLNIAQTLYGRLGDGFELWTGFEWKKIDVVVAIIVKDDKFFTARRKEGVHLAGYWEFPEGKLEIGESPEICLVLELKEELNITAYVGPFVGESIYDYGTKIVRLLAYQVNHISGDFELIDHDEIRWLALDELNSVEWAPAVISLVEQYKILVSTSSSTSALVANI